MHRNLRQCVHGHDGRGHRQPPTPSWAIPAGGVQGEAEEREADGDEWQDEEEVGHRHLRQQEREHGERERRDGQRGERSGIV